MNTVEKGDTLEVKVYKLLEPLVAEGIYGKYVTLSRHKKYKADAGFKILDVTIDVYHSQELMKEDNPFVTYVFECKNHDGILNAGRYDEWIGKLERLGPSKYKVFFVATKGFSQTTIQSATLKGFGLIKLADDCRFEYILQRTVNNCESFSVCLEELAAPQCKRPFLLFYHKQFSTLIDFFISEKIPFNVEHAIQAPYLTYNRIDSVANKLLSEITKCYSAEENLENILKRFPEIKVEYDESLPVDLLGKFVMDTKRIVLNKSLLAYPHRARFTIAHELGHYILHYKVVKKYILAFGDSKETLVEAIQEDEYKAFEIQANRFASSLLMPQELIYPVVVSAFKKFQINKGRLYVDSQRCNLVNYHQVLSYLSEIFKVSKLALAYRMQGLNLLVVDKSARFSISW